MKPKVLIIDDDVDILDILPDTIRRSGWEVTTASSTSAAVEALAGAAFDLVFSDVHMPGKSGFQLLEELNASHPNSIPPWVFITGDGNPETVERCIKAGGSDVIQKPFKDQEILAVLDRHKSREENPLGPVIHMVQKISGAKMGDGKRMLLETRVMRRARSLGIHDLREYLDYFSSHRDEEVRELISIVTTHTTEFFRERDHFTYLEQHVLPNLKAGDTFRLWSAACSTGEEVFSLAICVVEFLRKKNLLGKVQLEFVGTDIDFNSVGTAQEGVYPAESVRRVSSDLVDKYFEVAEYGGESWVRVCDDIYNLCQFDSLNLMGGSYPAEPFDVIFLRNVIIYFSAPQIKQVADQMSRCLKPEGLLFLGHSESITNIAMQFSLIGNSIYALAGSAGSRRLTSSSSSNKTRVMIVDDSATIRALIQKALSSEHGFEVVATAKTPLEAEKFFAGGGKADVMTLDIQMPEMDGITYLGKLADRADAPPVVMVSAVGYEDADGALRCFELGAVDYIEKPAAENMAADSERLRVVVKAAALAKLNRRRRPERASAGGPSPLISSKASSPGGPCPFDLLLIGSSTGGTEALKVVLQMIPEQSPPILIVQHIPARFSNTLAKRLNECCEIEVVEAYDGLAVEPSTAYIAPGAKQMKVEAQGSGRLVLRVNDDAPVNRHRPSVDYLFASATRLSPKLKMAAAILTGMGGDGAKELKTLHDQGAFTVAQDEATCVVFGMPKVAISLGAVDVIAPIDQITHHLMTGKAKKAAA